jgi:hypothetical protein
VSVIPLQREDLLLRGQTVKALRGLTMTMTTGGAQVSITAPDMRSLELIFLTLAPDKQFDPSLVEECLLTRSRGVLTPQRAVQAILRKTPGKFTRKYIHAKLESVGLASSRDAVAKIFTRLIRDGVIESTGERSYYQLKK